MADFKIAFLRTMGFEDDPRHPGIVTPEPHGGRARLGVNSLAHPELPDSFWTCSYEDALEFTERIFQVGYWAPLKLDCAHDQDIANKVYDIAVNMGTHQAAKYLQAAVQELPDGNIGPLTLAAVEKADPEIVLKSLRIQSANHYRNLAAKNPEEYAKWLPAWLERAAK